MDMRIIFSCKWKLCKEKDSVSLSLSSAMQLPRVADHVVWELKKSQLRIGLQYFTCVEIKLKEEKEGKKEEGGGGGKFLPFCGPTLTGLTQHVGRVNIQETLDVEMKKQQVIVFEI